MWPLLMAFFSLLRSEVGLCGGTWAGIPEREGDLGKEKLGEG